MPTAVDGGISPRKLIALASAFFLLVIAPAIIVAARPWLETADGSDNYLFGLFFSPIQGTTILITQGGMFLIGALVGGVIGSFVFRMRAAEHRSAGRFAGVLAGAIVFALGSGVVITGRAPFLGWW